MINIFDMMGPVMVGPSSSHTAGAARIGNMGRTLLGEEVARADIGLYGSFAETGYGHGTDRALLAGLLGMKPDDLRIPNAYEEANRAGMAYSFRTVELRDAHPNTALLELTGKSGKQLTLQASSIGGGAIVIGLAAVIIGEVLCDAFFRKGCNFSVRLGFVVLGGIVYYLVMVLILWLKLDPNDLKLFTAVIVAAFLAVPYLKGQAKSSFHRLKKGGK